MSSKSKYPVLANRPIDKWKVTELKEELKRRKLTVRGLKDDLIKRLAEALRIEREASEDNAANDFNCDVAGIKDAVDEAVDTVVRKSDETVETTEKHDTDLVEPVKLEDTKEIAVVEDNDSNKSDKPDSVSILVDSNSTVPAIVAEDVDTIIRKSDETVETTEKHDTSLVEPVELEDSKEIAIVEDNDSIKSDKLDGVSIPVGVNSTVPAVVAEEVETTEKHDTGLVEPVEMVDTEKIPEVVDNDSNKSDKLDGVTIPAVDQEVEHTDFSAGVDSAIVHSTVQTTVSVTKSVLTEVVIGGHDSYSAEPLKDDCGDSATKQENEDSKPLLESDRKLSCEDLKPNSSVPENQVSEVNPSLGSQVKSDSICSNSLSINQKNELKDIIIADNVKLEQETVRPEMLEEPSSRNDVSVYNGSYSMVVGELHEKKASDQENSSNSKNPDMNKTNCDEDVEYPEKINLDRISGDDSMEEDLSETKQFDSKYSADELRDEGENVKVPLVIEEGSTVVLGGGLSIEKIGTCQDSDIPPVLLVEKRKFHDQTLVGNNEPAKRQRRWNSEKIEGSDQQSPPLRPATTPKHNFSRSNSSLSDDAPKERIVPPSQRAPTNSLKIDRFLRPFTLKAVQELLRKTGNVITFWMDQIKTHCYVTYSSVEEAIETRNAVYNLQWPPHGGRLLVAEYVDPQEVKMKIEAPPPATPTLQPEPAVLPPPPPARERLPSPPPLSEIVDQPIVMLDDIFCKTRATPRIYYLPLSEEQVAAKRAAQGRNMEVSSSRRFRR